ncbi:DUF4147 domain-containing protein [Sulfurimonas sp. C5]|uniref:glycerate kinase type-2 family protein n=1 Tax=Sulfurimonas sp. C5 TaxID=3036947 RepID=UPI002457170C|nr:DUF4147 domain-containing protein [Sulfurimonas sp. C5]MDH4944035.1 DUF4147 domain-containing protein [Sulfurimonas sp. C5]
MSAKILLQKIFYKALEGVKADKIVKRNLSIDKEYLKISNQKIKLNSFNKLYIFGVGKAAYFMAKEAEKILSNRVSGGLIVSLEKQNLSYVKTCRSTHPQMSEKSVDCANKLIKEIQKLQKDDLFIFFLSGGASAMIEKPVDEISFEEFQKISNALLVSGIDIKALNKIRKSISAIKGGKLAKFFKAKGYVQVLSDVIGDDLNTIGSAPLYPDFPHYIIGNNTIALERAKKYVKSHVQKTKIVTTTLSTNSKAAAKMIAKEIETYNKEYDSFCLLFGGETTVEVQGNGLGGRNSELALRLLNSSCITKDIFILCAGSDGKDGNSEGDGAFIDYDIYKKIKKQKLNPKEYLQRNDSFSFFHQLGYSFVTGLTGTNVMDFVIILKQKF